MKKEVEYIEFTCEYCGKKFSRLRRHVKGSLNKGQPIRYCSRECANHGRDTRVEEKCCVCGKTILVQAAHHFENSRKTCSPECAKIKHDQVTEKIELECKNCHKKFYTTHSYYEKQQKRGQSIRYCSKECQMTVWQKNTVEISCKICGKKFRLNKEKVSLDGNCCSLACRKEFYKNNRHEVTCNYCGKTFYVTDSKFKQRKTGIFYCCEECRINSIKQSKYEYWQIAHYLRSTDNYKKWRLGVLEAANYTCSKCGVHSNVHAHHVKSLYDIIKENNFSISKALESDIFNDINNGQVLCIDCHQKEHPYLNKDKKTGRFMPLQDENETSLAIIKAELSGER